MIVVLRHTQIDEDDDSLDGGGETGKVVEIVDGKAQVKGLTIDGLSIIPEGVSFLNRLFFNGLVALDL